MNIFIYGFVWLVNFSYEKYIWVKKKKFLDIKKIYFMYLWIIYEFFPSEKFYSYSYLHILEFTNYSYSYSYRSWLHKSIPIPIRGENF